MEMHIILVFSLILMLALYTFHILFMIHFQRQKENTDFKIEYKWKKAIIILFIIIYVIITPINLFIIVDYILLLILQNTPTILIYLFLIIGISNYVLILSYLTIQTIFNNSLWIKVNTTTIFFLDEEISLHQIVGIDITGLFNKLIYQIDGEKEKKVIIGKKTFQFLEQINIPT